MRNVLIVSHADADGHVIAEQARRNLSAVKSFNVSVVVDPARTRSHKAWLNLLAIPEIERCEIVCFVDLMFAPATFGAEADALVSFARARPEKRFYVLDHHPLPIRKLSAAPNVHAAYFDDVLDCTVGPASPMMTIAALCETQASRAKDAPHADDVLIAKGVKRAAAIGGTLSGEKLAALLRFDCWADLLALGKEDPKKHRLPRGFRSKDEPPSTTLVRLDRLATDLLKNKSARSKHQTGKTMPYDFESRRDRSAPAVATFSPQARDLEAIVTLLQLAAIELTPEAGTSFSVAELLDRAREIGGEELGIAEADIKIVLGKAGFLKKVGAKLVLK